MFLSHHKIFRIGIRPLLTWGLCTCVWMSVTANAQAPIPEVEGWSGYLMLGAAYTDVKSNTVVGNDLIDGGNRTIMSINSSPRSNGNSHLLAGGELKYTLPRQNQIFFGG